MPVGALVDECCGPCYKDQGFSSIVSNARPCVPVVDKCFQPCCHNDSPIVSNAPDTVCLWGDLLMSAVSHVVTVILLHCE